MKLFIFSLLVMGATACSAGDALASSSATLELTDPTCDFSPQLFTPDWNGQRSKGGLVRDADGSYPFSIGAGTPPPIRGKAVFKQTAGGAVEASYAFAAGRDIALNALYVGTSLPTDRWAGGTWACESQNGELPLENRGLSVMAKSVTALHLISRDGKERLSLTFPKPTPVMLQDDRQWGPSFSVRIGYLAGTKTFKAGETFDVAFIVATQEPQRLLLDEPVTLQADADWIPLKAETEILAGSALDFSQLGLTDAPAGKHGRVVAKGPHFEFEGKPGVAQRFYGVNLCFSANYLEPADTARLATRLARTGYNALRLHHHDGGLVEGSADGTTVNPAQLARLEALIAACASNGIYLTTDLYVSRPVPWRSIGVDRDGKIEMNEYKMLVPVHEGAWNNLKTFTRQWLDHVNPYTGRRNADEPAIAWLAMINEGNFGNYMAEMRSIPEWLTAWDKWLAEKKRSEPQAYADIPSNLPDTLYAHSRHIAALVLFLKDMEDRMIIRMKAFLRDELRCRALVTNRNAWTNHASDQVPREELYDYVDDHFYVDHPEFIERPWQLPSKCANVNPIKNEAMGVQSVVFTRLLNKPFTITEYNYSGPGRFRGIGGIVTGTLGALQNWDGIWRFTYSHSRDNLFQPEGSAMGYFDMAADPLSLAAERASLCLFLRGDLAPLTRSYAIVIPKHEVLQMRADMPQNRTAWPWLAWYARLGTRVAGKPDAGITWSGQFPAVYDIPAADIRRLLTPDGAAGLPPAGDGAIALDKATGSLIINTPKTSGGFAESGIIDAGALIFDVGGTAATVWVSALDSNPIRSSSRLLLTHLTDVQNSGIHYAQQSRKTLLAWGRLPHLVRKGTAEIRLAVSPAKDYKVYALSTGGRRVAEVPCRVVKGRLAFTAAVDSQSGSATLLYEIAKKE
jgi:hypothetical protein